MSGPIRPPELSELETFVLAVEEGSIARAAVQLRISSPAAAKRIRQLEVLAHAPLLIRGRRGVRATEAGERLYPIARDLVRRRSDAVAVLGGAAPPDVRRKAGVRESLGRTPLPARDDAVPATEALLAAIFHATGEAFMLTRADDGLIYEINDAATTMLGYAYGELRGRLVSEIDLWVDPDRRNGLVREAVATRTPQRDELVVRGRGGEEHAILARFEALDLNGVDYILLTVREVLARRSSPPSPDEHRSNQRLGDRYLAALRRGEPLVAASVAEEALASYGDVAQVHSDLIAPAMKAIGELWERNVISVADEHLATEISHKVASRLFFSVLADAPRQGERVLLAAVQGEHHVLGLRLVADVLEGAGYDVLYLGANVPLESLLDACRAYNPQVLGLTVGMPLNIPTLVWEIGEVAKLARPPHLMIGGRVAETAMQDGLDAGYAAGSDEVLELVGEMLRDEREISRN